MRQVYKNSMNSLNIDMIDDSKIYEMCKDSKIVGKDKVIKKVRTLKTKFKVTIVAASLATLSCISVFAYERSIHYKQLNKTAGNTHEYINADDDKTIVMNKTKTDRNLTVTVADVKMDSRSIFMKVNISTIDGTAINESDEFNVASINNNGFKEAYLTDGINNYDITKVVRTDDGSNTSQAQFELSLHVSAIVNKVGVEKNTSSFAVLKDKDIKLVLKNYVYPLIKLTDIGFTENNLQSLCEKINKGESVNFSDKARGINIISIKNDTYKKNVDSKAIPGIFITYSVSNQADKELVKKLELFNNITGLASKAVSELVDDKFSDNGKTEKCIVWNESENELTLCYISRFEEDFYNHLDDYKLVGSSNIETMTIAGSWTFEVPVKFEDALTYETNVKKAWEDGEVEINNVEISDSYLIVSTKTVREDTIKEGYVNINITLVLKDGKLITVGNDRSGNAQFSDIGIFEYYFSDLVNAEDVVGFYFGEEYVKLK